MTYTSVSRRYENSTANPTGTRKSKSSGVKAKQWERCRPVKQCRETERDIKEVCRITRCLRIFEMAVNINQKSWNIRKAR